MVDVQFSHHKTQVLSEPGACSTPTQKPAVREPPESVPRVHFALLEGRKGGQRGPWVHRVAG